MAIARREIEDRFINEWGLLANAWGVSPLLGRIHGLLLLAGRPMTAEEVCERLNISRASASVQLNAILGWGLARRMYLPSDRRQHYLAEPEPWTWFRRAVRVRKEREFDPVIAGLVAAAAEAHTAARAAGDDELRGEAERLAYLLKFVRLFFGGIETFLQIEPTALQAFLKMAEESETPPPSPSLGRGSSFFPSGAPPPSPRFRQGRIVRERGLAPALSGAAISRLAPRRVPGKL